MNTINTKYIVGIVIAVLILIIGFVFINNEMNGGTAGGPDLSSFAMCIKDKGTIFYGAFWCPHCAATKAMFGAAAKDLPYHECSTPDGNGQNAECTAAGVKGYPTWVFADGTRLQGETTLQTLAERTGCTLPQGVTPGAQDTTNTGASSSASLSASSAVSGSSTTGVGGVASTTINIGQ